MQSPLPQLRWLFVDMDSFFASIEQHLRPEFRDQPVGVVPVKSEGTCVIAASRQAKAFGVKTGTRVLDARKLCPEITFLKARPDVYVQIHHAVARSIERCVPIHKAYSIDEWAIELRGSECTPSTALEVGRNIKQSILKDFSPAITCSVGIAPTRLLAKIASDVDKPNGICALQLHDLPHRLSHLKPKDLCGIGRGMADRLERSGVHTIEELWNLSKRESVHIWNSVTGADWWTGFHGIDEPEMPTRKSSMTHANVLDPKFRNEHGARAILTRLVCRLGSRLRRDGYVAATLAIKVSFLDGSRCKDAISLGSVQDTPGLLEALYRMWERIDFNRARPIQVCATVHDLTRTTEIANILFEDAHNAVKLSSTIDSINNRWGLSSIYYCSMHGYCHQMDDKIAFGRIPDSAKPTPWAGSMQQSG